VGCGTGQLTGDLGRYGFDLTAIDIGPAMIAAARQHLGDAAISFQACSFEDFAAAGSSFDLIVSATAFHWVDPEVRFSKSARLLRPGGWLALLAIGERYDDPLNRGLTCSLDSEFSYAILSSSAIMMLRVEGAEVC
jgi:2-polyprenyl-3-methyl-5-hydroxy-6-metoxy-1,4-benzoquinol methylase